MGILEGMNAGEEWLHREPELELLLNYISDMGSTPFFSYLLSRHYKI